MKPEKKQVFKCPCFLSWGGRKLVILPSSALLNQLQSQGNLVKSVSGPQEFPLGEVRSKKGGKC